MTDEREKCDPDTQEGAYTKAEEQERARQQIIDYRDHLSALFEEYNGNALRNQATLLQLVGMSIPTVALIVNALLNSNAQNHHRVVVGVAGSLFSVLFLSAEFLCVRVIGSESRKMTDSWNEARQLFDDVSSLLPRLWVGMAHPYSYPYKAMYGLVLAKATIFVAVCLVLGFFK